MNSTEAIKDHAEETMCRICFVVKEMDLYPPSSLHHQSLLERLFQVINEYTNSKILTFTTKQNRVFKGTCEELMKVLIKDLVGEMNAAEKTRQLISADYEDLWDFLKKEGAF